MKIFELLIDEESDFEGVDAVALVENPAIEADFFAFSDDDVLDSIAFHIIKLAIQEHFVQKLPGESKADYVARCVPVVMQEGHDQDQALAICYADYEAFDETADPQELIIGDYQTRHYDICPGASALYRQIESQQLDVDMGLAIRAAKLQDALFYLEKHTVKEMQKASFEDVKAAEILAEEIMHLARMMGLEKEHQYIAGHVEAIRNLYREGEQQMEVDVTGLPDYVNEIQDKKKIHFESYTDYPESATNAARRALEWRDNHPDQDCGTRVGWARANQLAKKEPISEETIARMASFARHLQHEDVPYSEGCGGLMVDAWGGRAGIEWAQRKLDEIRDENSAQSFSFAVAEDQQMVVGPLMIPNKLILRVNPETMEPYYVYFSEQTIKQVAEKVMRDNQMHNLNIEHNNDDKVEGYMVSTWLVEDPQKDKQQIYGFNYPKGTWMGQYKITDKDVWLKAKKGEIKGFSVEGFFSDRFVQASKLTN